MIALNEIIANKELFEKKYKLMGKRANLDKIIKLEEQFIILDKKSNELRANCNKLCSEIAELVNTNKDSKHAILKINTLDKEISVLEKKSSKAMKSINNKLKKLPNLPLDENVLNIPIKSKNTAFGIENFVATLSNIAEPEIINLSEKKYIDSLKKVVIKAENLPKLINLKGKNKKFLILCGSNSQEILETIFKTLWLIININFFIFFSNIS